jgi:hypothetical protein
MSPLAQVFPLLTGEYQAGVGDYKAKAPTRTKEWASARGWDAILFLSFYHLLSSGSSNVSRFYGSQCVPGSARFIFILSSLSRGNDGDREQWESWPDFH